MEIPYTFTARKDTGLFNSKIALWLFLASEVMLFGGLFSGYVFLRIYSDYPWPERTLPILPGLINTFVLIGSSVTVVFAWAALKMRQWRRFQFFMGITIACAVIFMILKGIEYNAKWHHQAVRMDDYTIVEGHTHKATLDEKGEYKAILKNTGAGGDHGKSDKGEKKAYAEKFKGNKLLFRADEVSFSIVRTHQPYVKKMMKQAKKAGSKIVLTEPIIKYSGKGTELEEKKELYPAGTELDPFVLKDLRVSFIDARSRNQKLRTAELRRLWREVKKEHPDKTYHEQAKLVKLDASVLATDLIDTPSQVSFKVEPAMTFVFGRNVIKESAEIGRLKDDSVLRGELVDSPTALAVDAVDFTFMAQRAEEAGKVPDEVIEKSWLLQQPEFREIWEKHKEYIKTFEEKLAKKGKEPTEKDRYRIGWKQMVEYSGQDKPGVFSGFSGPNHKNEDFQKAFLELEVPGNKVAFESVFEPKWNTYYAIYFTITGLHGLHVIGGVIVLGYYLFFSKGLYLSNPEWLANRVEIGGLFWHFVDLVWIFLFPILYLM